MGYFLTILCRLGQTLSMGTGIHIVFSLGGIFFLGFPTVINASTYALALSEKAGLAPLLAFSIAICVGFTVSLFFSVLFLKVSMESFLILGLTSIVAFEALVNSLDTITNGSLGISGIQRPSIFSSLPALTVVTLVFAVIFVIFEVIILKTSFGRRLRAIKESPLTLESLGISTNKVSSAMILITGVMFSIGGCFMVWEIQFLDPKFVGIPFLIQILTIGIIALQPKTRLVSLGTLFVVFAPELFRFLDLPSTIFAQARIILYCATLLILIITFQDTFSTPQRSI